MRLQAIGIDLWRDILKDWNKHWMGKGKQGLGKQWPGDVPDTISEDRWP